MLCVVSAGAAADCKDGSKECAGWRSTRRRSRCEGCEGRCMLSLLPRDKVRLLIWPALSTRGGAWEHICHCSARAYFPYTSAPPPPLHPVLSRACEPARAHPDPRTSSHPGPNHPAPPSLLVSDTLICVSIVAGAVLLLK